MTIDEALAKAKRQLGGHLQRRWDALFLRLIEDGINPENSWIFDEQQRIDRAWLDDTLAHLRHQLTHDADEKDHTTDRP